MIGRGQEASVHPWALIRKVSREEAINAIPGISGCYNTPITRREQDKFLWLIFEPTFPEQSVKEEATCKFCRRTLKGTSALYHARAHLGFKPFPYFVVCSEVYNKATSINICESVLKTLVYQEDLESLEGNANHVR